MIENNITLKEDKARSFYKQSLYNFHQNPMLSVPVPIYCYYSRQLLVKHGVKFNLFYATRPK